MSTATAQSTLPYGVTADLIELLSFTDLPWAADRWGVPTLTLPNEEYEMRVMDEDGTFSLTVYSGGKAHLIHTEARFSGCSAQAALLATIDALIAEMI